MSSAIDSVDVVKGDDNRCSAEQICDHLQQSCGFRVCETSSSRKVGFLVLTNAPVDRPQYGDTLSISQRDGLLCITVYSIELPSPESGFLPPQQALEWLEDYLRSHGVIESSRNLVAELLVDPCVIVESHDGAPGRI